MPIPTPVLVAAACPKALSLAAERAGTVARGLSPVARAEEIRTATASVAQREFVVGVFVVGDRIPDEVRRFVRDSAAKLAQVDSPMWLPDDPGAAADKLIERREKYGISTITAGANHMDFMAQVQTRLSER
jgi:hypothetical protein